MARTKIYDLFSEGGLFGQSEAALDWMDFRQPAPLDEEGKPPQRRAVGQLQDTMMQDPMRAARGWGF